MTPPHLLAAILAFLKTLPVPAIDAHEVDRDVRLGVIATAINTAAERSTCMGEFAIETCKPIARDAVEVAAGLIEWADAETALRSNVHDGRCLDTECDSVTVWDRTHFVVNHRARGLYQFHRLEKWSNETWNLMHGTSQEATSAASWEAAKRFSGAKGTCKSIEGAFANIARGKSCVWSGAKKRAQRAEQIRWRLVTLMGAEKC